MTEPAPHLSPACPICRAPVPADAPSGACPKCLLGVGIPTGGTAADPDGLGLADVAARFPDYEILGFLGRGGMGVVWKARHRGLDRVVALKVLPRDVAKVTGFADRFRREARALARLSHPNIVGVHEYGDRDGTFFLVMEYAEGVNMRRALREGLLRPADALRIVPQICDALQYAHDHGVVHRDIKPENIVVCLSGAKARGDVAEPRQALGSDPGRTGEGNIVVCRTGAGPRDAGGTPASGTDAAPASPGDVPVRLDPAAIRGAQESPAAPALPEFRVKVADFGLAKIVGGESSADLTLTGQVMGTPAYMAPEQVERPLSVDHRADIYSLGVVFYEMLTGELPLGRFEAPSKRVQVDVRFDEVVLRSLEKAPERRWQQASDVKSEVGAIAAGPAPVVAPPAPFPPPSPPSAQAASMSIWGFTRETQVVLLRVLVFVSVFAAGMYVISGGRSRLLPAAIWAGVAFLAVRRLRSLVSAVAAEKGAAPRAPGPVTPRPAAAAGADAAGTAAPRWNRPAVVGVALIVFGVVFTGIAAAAGWGGVAWGVALAGGGLALVSMILGIVGWVQISRSHGTQRGLAAAVFAALCPIVVPCLVGPLYLLVSAAPGPLGTLTISDESVPHEPRTEESTEFGFPLRNFGDWPAGVRAEDARDIHALWARLTAAYPVAAADAGQFYGASTWERLDVVGRWPERSAMYLAGAAGLPLLDPNRLGGRLADSPIQRVDVHSDRSRAQVVVQCLTQRLTVALERTPTAWAFAAEPVMIELYEPVGGLPPGESLIAPIDTRMQLRDFWFALQEAHPDVSVSDVKRWYARDVWPRVQADWAAGGAEAAARGERGLPFMSVAALGEPLSAFHGFSIAVDEAGRTATLTATSDTRRFIARLRFAESVWRFTDDPVKIETK